MYSGFIGKSRTTDPGYLISAANLAQPGPESTAAKSVQIRPNPQTPVRIRPAAAAAGNHSRESRSVKQQPEKAARVYSSSRVSLLDLRSYSRSIQLYELVPVL